LLGNPDLDDAGVLALRSVLTDTGAHARVEALVTQGAQAARDAVRSVEGIDPTAAAALDALIDVATSRTS
jgi:geranylgeranyl diphosphate synthase type I